MSLELFFGGQNQQEKTHVSCHINILYKIPPFYRFPINTRVVLCMNIGKTYSLRGLAASCPCRNNYSVQEKKETTIQALEAASH